MQKNANPQDWKSLLAIILFVLLFSSTILVGHAQDSSSRYEDKKLTISELLKLPGNIIGEGTNATPTGKYRIAHYRIEEVLLPKPVEISIKGREVEVSRAFRITVTGGPFAVRAVAPVIWIDDAAIGYGIENVDLNEITVVTYDQSLLREGGTIYLSYGDKDNKADREALPEKLKLNKTQVNGEALKPDSGKCEAHSSSFIVLDLQGNGFNLTDCVNGVAFDFNGDGAADHAAWTSIEKDNAGSETIDDALLTLDRNGDGTINNGAELFGSLTPQPDPPNGVASNGFLALAAYDQREQGGNGDGIIDNKDAVFSSLRLWQDQNHNGISEPGELHPLTQLGVAQLSLDYKESKRVDKYGNQFIYRAKFKDARNVPGTWAWEVSPVSN